MPAGPTAAPPVDLSDVHDPKLATKPIIVPVSSNIINCICGKPCKGRRGLKAHQRSCKTAADLEIDSNKLGLHDGSLDGEGGVSRTL